MSSSITPLIMNLTGQYAADYQNILNKAVQTASVPLTLLQTQDATVLAHKTALGSLQTTVGALTTSLTSLGSLGSTTALSATSSNPAAVTATNSGATAAASYTINSITSIATAASETSKIGYLDSGANTVSASGDMDLVVGTTHHTFTLTNNNLTGLRDQINGLQAGVTASILTTSDGNFLSVQSNTTGATPLKLVEDPAGAATDFMTSQNQGTNAVFQLNGLNISQNSNTVNSVVPGLTFKIIAPTATPLTLSLDSDSSQLSTSLQDFVTSYNGIRTALTAQAGQTGGALVGDRVISQLRTALLQLTSYSGGTGSIHSFAAMGVTFDGPGGLAVFSPTTFNALTTTQVSDGLNYLGTKTTGMGSFASKFRQFSDPISGQIQLSIAGDTTSDTHLQTRITNTTAQIVAMQKSLALQIAKSDALEAAFESQQTTLDASLQGLNLVLYGKKT